MGKPLSTGSLLTSCIVGFFTGLSVGTGVLVSLAEGEKNGEKIRKIIHTAAGISLLGGVLLTVLGLLLSRQLLVWMNTPAEILEQGLLYIRIYLLSMLPLFVYNMNAGIIRAGGDARTPMLFQLLGAAVNILLDWLSMAHWGMGVDGAAWATAFSQMVAALGSVIYLVQTAVNGLGVTAIAAFTAYFKVELILYLPIMAFGQAATTFAGQNLGAGKPERLRRGIRTCLLLGSVYAAGMAALMLLLGRPAFGLFTRETAVIEAGLRIIRVTFPCYWLYVFLEVHADALRGCGRSVLPMAVIMTCLCALRTGLLAVFTNVWGTLEAVAAVYPCAWLAAAVCLTVCWRRYAVKPIKK